MNINKYNPTTQTLNHLAAISDDINYSQFCQRLAKSGEVMDKEISEKERSLYNKTIELNLNFTLFAGNLPHDIFVDRKYGLCIEHMTIGVLGEIGELLDVIKNIVIYRKDISSLDKEGKRLDNVFVEEIGDILFYKTELMRVIKESSLFLNNGQLESSCNHNNKIIDDFINEHLTDIIFIWNDLNGDKIRPVTLKMCVENNVIKLAKRYKNGSYSDKQAVEREDKKD